MYTKLKNLLIKYCPLLVFILAYTASVSAYFYLSSQGLTLAIEDGRAHLNIARRVIDSLTPGLTQLGGIWLPLPHVLMLPLIGNTYLWHSGLAGIIPSMIFFIIGAVFLYKLISEVTESRLAGFVGSLVYISNPNLLFIQATPMTESTSISLFVIILYCFWRWMKSKNDLLIILTGLITCLLSLTRYEGWVLPIILSVCIVLFGISEKWSLSKIEGRVILYFIPAILGMVFWGLYNLVIFKNPLNFLNGEGSAAWFAKYEELNNMLPTKGNILISSQVYGTNIGDIVGYAVVTLSILGLAIFVLRYKNDKISYKRFILLLALLAPLLFNVYSLFNGTSVMWSRWTYPFKIYNVRYALQVLPLIAILIAYLVTIKRTFFTLLIIFVLVLQMLLFATSGPLVLLQDITQTKGSAREKVGLWLKNNPTSGLTLISGGANDVAIFDSNTDLKNIVYEGNEKLWKKSLINPYPQISRIVMGSPSSAQTDKVYTALHGKSILSKYYKKVYGSDNYSVYQRIDNSKKPLHSWDVKSIDTMKTSRDQAQHGISNVNYQKELQEIKDLGANYVAIDTPYDEEFYPYLKSWVDEARVLGLRVWFRGNWSGWEGWNEYPKNLTRQQHVEKTKQFISSHPELFKDGDSFTACPECEYGGPGSPVSAGEIDSFRKFMVDEYIATSEEFKKIGKKVTTNWFSMNPDVAEKIYTEKLLEDTGNIITLDYFVKDKEQLVNGLNFFSKKFPGVKILVGEFGAPLSAINENMNDQEQKEFVSTIFSYLKTRKDILGVNYWVSSGGSTRILDDILNPKPAAEVVKNDFLVKKVSGTLLDKDKQPLEGVTVYINSEKQVTESDKNGKFSFTYIGNNLHIDIISTKYKAYSHQVTGDKNGNTSIVYELTPL